uniref:Laccase n=1 Tax=Leersia perrieri TaxID=77586 RepID=A0A0D9WUH8_9ORYZ
MAPWIRPSSISICSGVMVVFSCVLMVMLQAAVDAAIVEHTFHVGNLTVERLGQRQVITAVNGQFPGPKVEAREGDTIVVRVVNESPYNMSIHWHGVLQRLSAWADGPGMVTQCPILPGGASYVYRFNVTGQEGTLWWHAHVSFLRATVYGALLIRPRRGVPYPFPFPHAEHTLLLGEWWNKSLVDVERQAFLTGGQPANSVALTINGVMDPDHEVLRVSRGSTYLLRLINAALNYQLFFKVAAHKFTVVAVDACYTDPYHTDVIVIAPGQTVDALMHAGAGAAAAYYVAAQVYQSVANATYTATARAILRYTSTSSDDTITPAAPSMPAVNDSATAQRFYGSLTGLLRDGGKPTVPQRVDTRMLVTYGLAIAPCLPAQTLCNRTRGSLAASMNNVSFQLPQSISLLQASRTAAQVVYARDFPDRPPLIFDFTNASSVNTNMSLMLTSRETRVKLLRYKETVELVLQNTAVLGTENHPLHLHGFNFYVLAQGAGNFLHHHRHHKIKYNLFNPQQRNTIAVPAGGWAVIRFTADNPGVWLMHCHLEAHLPFGLAMAFEVQDGPTPDAMLPPPPNDYPPC